jgi:hypothetical protein
MRNSASVASSWAAAVVLQQLVPLTQCPSYLPVCCQQKLACFELNWMHGHKQDAAA